MKTHTRIVSVFLSLVMLFGITAGIDLSTYAFEYYTDYTYGDFTYYIKEDDTIVLKKYNGLDSIVETPSKINGFSISELYWNCFEDCNFIRKIVYKSGSVI